MATINCYGKPQSFTYCTDGCSRRKTYRLLKMRSAAQKLRPCPQIRPPAQARPLIPGSSYTNSQPLQHPAQRPGNARDSGPRKAAGKSKGARAEQDARSGSVPPAPLTSSFRERLETFFSILAAVFSAPRPFSFLAVVVHRAG